jgi:hypothetical protein
MELASGNGICDAITLTLKKLNIINCLTGIHMELASDLLFSEEIKQTMRILPRNLSQPEVSEYFAQIKKPMQQINSTFQRYLEEQRELLSDGYFGKHPNSELLSCRTTGGVEVVFCPSDHSGVWAGFIVKGSLGERTQLTLEGIAKAKGLI